MSTSNVDEHAVTARASTSNVDEHTVAARASETKKSEGSDVDTDEDTEESEINRISSELNEVPSEGNTCPSATNIASMDDLVAYVAQPHDPDVIDLSDCLSVCSATKQRFATLASNDSGSGSEASGKKKRAVVTKKNEVWCIGMLYHAVHESQSIYNEN